MADELQRFALILVEGDPWFAMEAVVPKKVTLRLRCAANGCPGRDAVTIELDGRNAFQFTVKCKRCSEVYLFTEVKPPTCTLPGVKVQMSCQGRVTVMCREFDDEHEFAAKLMGQVVKINTDDKGDWRMGDGEYAAVEAAINAAREPDSESSDVEASGSPSHGDSFDTGNSSSTDREEVKEDVLSDDSSHQLFAPKPEEPEAEPVSPDHDVVPAVVQPRENENVAQEPFEERVPYGSGLGLSLVHLPV